MMKSSKPAAKTAWLLTSFVGQCALPALRAILCGLLLLIPAVLFGQDAPGDNVPSSASRAEAAEKDDTSSLPETAGKDDPGLLLNEQQKKLFLEWLKSQESPDYSITSVQLKGSANGDQIAANGDKTAKIKAEIGIQINRDDRAYRIPLYLNEATLDSHEYRGNGTATPDDVVDREKGYQWWLRGQGQHVLELSLIVPIKQQLPNRRLQLTIPPTVVSGLELQVPLDRLSAKVIDPPGAWVEVNSIPKAGSIVKVRWSGRKLDLEWKPILQRGPVETVLQSRTLLDVKLTDESVVIEATQRIQALQGSFSQFDVTLPAGFELTRVEGKDFDKQQIGAGSQVTVTLLGPVQGSTELKWTLEAPFPGSGGKLTLDGFEVSRARRQEGEIAIRGLDGYRMTRREADDRYVHRMSVAELANGEQATTAYKILKQPFRLVLDLQEIEPGFTVKPRLRLRMQPERIQLEGTFEFQVYRGAVREFQLVWPQAGKQGWEIGRVGPPELLSRDQATTQLQNVPLELPLLGRKTGKFTVELRASRPIVAGEEFELSLPSIAASSSDTTLLDVFTEENAEVELTRDGMGGGRLTQQTSGSPELLPEDLRQLVRATYRIDDPQAMLKSKLNIHEREVSTRTSAQIALDGRKLLVSQRITYDVAFERLPQVLLLVPKELGQRVQFLLGDDVELSPTVTPLDEGTFHEIRLTLPEGQIGEFDVTARFAVDLPSLPLRGDSREVAVPLVQSSDSEIRTTRLEWDQSGRFDIAPMNDEVWVSRSSLRDSLVWVADGARQDVSLRISESIRKRTQDLYVHKALLRSVVESNGVSRSWAQYRIDSSTSGVTIKLPPGRIVLDGAWWQDRRLDASEIVVVDEARGEYRFEDANATTIDNRLLTLEFHSQNARPLNWSREHQLASPEFAAGVWVEESIWNISLPGNQLLFTEPSNYTPRYRWQRSGILWSRQTAASHTGINDWIGAKDGPVLPLNNATGNTYRFSRFGPPAVLAYRVMSLPFVVFLGAGLSLAAGFVLLYLPLTRNVLTFLFVAFSVSILSLWFPAPVEVLLQPAVLGLVLAVVAAFINSMLRREKQVPVLTLSSPSDFGARISGLSSVESVPGRGPGSEEPTTLRPAANSAKEMVAAPESGSHL